MSGLLGLRIENANLRQILVLVGALAGGGGLLKVDGWSHDKAQGDRVTATASLSVNTLEQLSKLQETVGGLQGRLDRLEGKGRQRRRLREPSETGAVADSVFHSDLAGLPPALVP